ncbi:MAG: transposase [Candidatus Sulfotelmatobacter sp.]
MTRECHVRICERLEVKLLRPTRHFGMKAHVGVDSQTKLIHSVVATAANAADSTMLLHLLHGEETRVWGDQAYRGQSEVLREHAPHAQDFTHQRYRYKDHIDEVEREKNRTKSKVRSKVEHVFAVLKLKFGFVKVRYRGVDKNANRLFVTCALVNLSWHASDCCARRRRSSARSYRIALTGGKSKRHPSWGEPNHRLPRSLPFAWL